MRYLGQRLIQFVLVFVIVTFLVMAATRIGHDDPARDLAGGAVSDRADRAGRSRTTRTSTTRCRCSTATG